MNVQFKASYSIIISSKTLLCSFFILSDPKLLNDSECYKATYKNSLFHSPQTYLKEILRDIGIYNVKGTHKNTWELKPEYRHYQSEEKSD